MSKRSEVRVSGVGGQGVILCAHIMGKAASIFTEGQATMTQAFGPEARGSACSAQVVISDSQISYPYPENPLVMVAMSQEAYTKYVPGLGKGALLLIDKELVKPKKSMNNKVLAIPATRIARELGRTAVANIVMLGFLTATSRIISVNAMKKAVLDSVPKGTEELNMKAFERGYSYGLEKLKTSGGEGR